MIEALFWFGGVQVVLLGLLGWLGKLWLKRILAKERAHVDAVAQKIGAVHDATSGAFSDARPRVQEAIADLWKQLVAFRGRASLYYSYHQLISPDQISKSEPACLEAFAPPTHGTDVLHSLPENFWSGLDVETHRPFLGEKLWGLFAMHRSFCGRLAWKGSQVRRLGRFIHWNLDPRGERDALIFAVLDVAFTGNEQNEIIASSPVGIPHRFVAAIERKILEECGVWIFGKGFSALSLEQYMAIEKAARANP